MHIGFTGTQEGMTEAQSRVFEGLILSLFQAHHQLVFHHGDCVGADMQAHAIFHDLAVDIHAPATIVIHPPTKNERRAYADMARGGAYTKIPVERMPPADYLVRNHQIVVESELLIACPKTEGEALRSGTWATVRYARAMNIPQHIIFPSGVKRGPQS